MEKNRSDVVIIGGLGHVGLPLGIVFASKGLKVFLNDINEESAEKVRRGQMPFIEYGSEPLLIEMITNGNLVVSLDPESISGAKYVIIAIGTPVDEYLNPKTRQFLEFIQSIKKYLAPSQVIIIRSSVFPNTCKQILKELGNDLEWHVAYCPERIVQGYAVQELEKLPQIVSGFTKKAVDEASALFSMITQTIIPTSIREAELMKLFSNSWRYIQFSIANQFYMICEDFGVDYDRVRSIIVEGYDRAEGLPSAGFAAGPCLLKDTMQLSAFNNNNFLLGHAAMMINEGLPNFIVNILRSKYELAEKKVGILGMAFKADVDDIRDSLSYKLGKILRFHGARVFYSDEYVNDPDFVLTEELLKECDIVIIGSPHSAYKKLKIPRNLIVVDLWGITNKQ